MELWRALGVRRHETVALVGGGGKTTAMFRLGRELAAQGRRVILTTTTHLGLHQVTQAPHVTLTAPHRLEGLPTVSPLLITGPPGPPLKVTGLPPELVDRLAELSAEVVVNEADGARTLPFKAPAEHEPVIPPGTTLVVPVVGVDVIGQPLDAAHVHRPGRVTALSGASHGRPVTPEVVAAVLGHPQGGLKGVPDQARVVVLVNKVEGEARQRTARRLADLLLGCPRIEAVVAGAVQVEPPALWVRQRVAVVVLAAGESRRFGALKQLAPWGEGTLLTHAVEVALASQADRVVVVLGCQAEACRAALVHRGLVERGGARLELVVNSRWAEGQSTSVRAGLAALSARCGAAVFHLADQPAVTPAVLDALIARHAATRAPVVWPAYEGRRGNPVLFDRVTFPALRRLTGDVGGREVLRAWADQGEEVAVGEAGVLLDVDTPRDWAASRET